MGNSIDFRFFWPKLMQRVVFRDWHTKASLYNFLIRIFHYLYTISLRPTVWPLIAAEIMIMLIAMFLTASLGGKESSNQNDYEVLFFSKLNLLHFILSKFFSTSNQFCCSLNFRLLWQVFHLSISLIKSHALIRGLV